MEPEEIIAIAIREAFKCGKEEGEAYQRMWSNMNEKIEKAKKGESDYQKGLYDGFFCQLQNFTADVDLAKPGTESEEVKFTVQSVPDNRIGSEPNEQIAAMKDMIAVLEKEVNKLQKQCEEKDATITKLREELSEKESEICHLTLQVPELKYSSLPLDWYVISQKANHRRKVAERKYRKKYLKKKEECRYQTERADNAFEKISELRSDLEDCKCELRKYKNNIERAVKEERERQEENDAMRIVSLQTLLKEKKDLVEKLKKENEALRRSI